MIDLRMRLPEGSERLGRVGSNPTDIDQEGVLRCALPGTAFALLQSEEGKKARCSGLVGNQYENIFWSLQNVNYTPNFFRLRRTLHASILNSTIGPCQRWKDKNIFKRHTVKCRVVLLLQLDVCFFTQPFPKYRFVYFR